MVGKALLFLLVLSFVLTGPLCYSQTSVKVSDPRFEVIENILYISYDILNSDPSDRYKVSIDITDASGTIIAVNSLSGDIGENVIGGLNKTIFWDITLYREAITVGITVQIHVERINSKEMIDVDTVDVIETFQSLENFCEIFNRSSWTNPLLAARIVEMPTNKENLNQLAFGLGNYLTPLAEINLISKESRQNRFGFRVRHHSMNGQLKLDNDLKTDAGFNENLGEIFGNRSLKKSIFDYSLGAEYNSYVHYGIDPSLDTVLSREDAIHPYFNAEAGIRLRSIEKSSNNFHYDVSIDYYYFTHQFDQVEQAILTDLKFIKNLKTLDIGSDASIAFYGHSPSWDTILGNHTILNLNPYIAKKTDTWKLSAGINAYSQIENDILSLNFYPNISFQFNTSKKVIVPYIGIDGYLESNNLRKTVDENPYVVPGLSLRPTDHKLIAYAGLKGSSSDVVAYDVNGSYSIIDDQYFFVNDYSNSLMNQFSVVYDDITIISLSGEFSLAPNDSWKILLKGIYSTYTLVREDYAWNKPSFDLSFQVKYRAIDKLNLNGGLFSIGPRYYENYNPVIQEALPIAIYSNLDIDYQISKSICIWLRLYGPLEKLYIYHQYPTVQTRVIIGVAVAI